MRINQKAKATKSSPEDARTMLFNMRKNLFAGPSARVNSRDLIAGAEPGDELDFASDQQDRELSLLLSHRDREKLFAINEGLEKIKEGSYGICEECGEQIGAGRLKVMPLAKCCVECQGKIEKEMDLDEDLKHEGLPDAIDTGDEEP